MKSLWKVFSVSALALAMTGCAPTEYETEQKEAVYEGVTAQSLDDTQGVVKNAIIYAPAQFRSGGNTIAEVHVGSLRGCFTQMTDAASVNYGPYRVDCIGPAGNMVARYSTESQGYQSWKGPSLGEKKGVHEVYLELNSRQLP